MLSPEAQVQCEDLLQSGLDTVTTTLLALAATQPGLAIEAYGALVEAVYPYLQGDRRAQRLLLVRHAVEALLQAG